MLVKGMVGDIGFETSLKQRRCSWTCCTAQRRRSGLRSFYQYEKVKLSKSVVQDDNS